MDRYQKIQASVLTIVLTVGPPAFAVWLDKHRLEPGQEQCRRPFGLQRGVEPRSELQKAGHPAALSYGAQETVWTGRTATHLATAAQTIAVARQYDYPANNANVLALQGIMQLRLGPIASAQEAFGAAVAQANALLVKTPQNYAAQQTLGLAQAGLAICRDSTGQSPTAARQAALTAYQAARAITCVPGIVQRALRLFDALAVVDAAGVVAGVRAVVAKNLA